MYQIQLTTISSKRPNSKVLNLSNINQINLWIQSSIEKVSKQASTQLIIQPIEKLVTDQLIHQSVRPSVAINKSVSQIVSESVSQSISQSPSLSDSVSEAASRLVSQEISWSVNWSAPAGLSTSQFWLVRSIKQLSRTLSITDRETSMHFHVLHGP